MANVSQIVTLDKCELTVTVRVGKLPKAKLELVLSGVDVVLGRQATAEQSVAALALRH